MTYIHIMLAAMYILLKSALSVFLNEIVLCHSAGDLHSD